MTDFEHGSGKPIKSIHSDNGSEFVNQHTKMLFLRERIVHETSAPYTAQQNGRIEREIKTLSTMARVMLCEASLPEHLQHEALRTACYLKNRTPPAEKGTTPYERFMGRKPNLTNLVEFGTRVQILDTRQKRGKLDPKTVNGYVTGFTSRRNTYRVFVPEYNRVVVTCDVFFGPHRQETKPHQPKATQENDALIRVRWADSLAQQQVSGETAESCEPDREPGV